MDTDKPLRWLYGEVKTPPFTQTARLEVGWLLRRLQQGEKLFLGIESFPSSGALLSPGRVGADGADAVDGGDVMAAGGFEAHGDALFACDYVSG